MATAKQIRRRGRLPLVLGVLVAAAMLAGVAGAATWTDREDYTPGSTVTISGDNRNDAGYLAGETVQVDVSGPNEWTASCNAVADDAGAWSCQVTLADGFEAIGDYEYTATGLESGVTESGTFRDGSFFARAVIPGGIRVAAQFPGDPTGATSTIFGYDNSTTCSGTPDKFNPALVTLSTAGAGSSLSSFPTTATNSNKLVAPATVTHNSVVYAFSSWTVISDFGIPVNGSVVTTGTAGCFSGWNPTISTIVQANYVLAAPTVTINSVTPNPVKPSDANTAVNWKADQAGTYDVRKGGTDCSTGTSLHTGTYATANTNVDTTIAATSLDYGGNTIRVCVTNAGSQTGAATTTVYRQVPTTLAYSGDPIAVDPADPVFKATLSDSQTACDVRGKTIRFYVDLTGDGDFDDIDENLGTAATATASPATGDSAQAILGEVVLDPGIYVVKVEFEGTNECAASSDDTIVAVVTPDDATNGGGWYQIAGENSASKRVNFGYTTRWDAKAGAYTGQIVVHNKFAWRLKGQVNAFSKSGTSYPLSGSLSGTGALYCWDATNETWKLADASVSFIASIYDTGPPPKKGATKPDKFTVKTIAGYSAGSGCPTSITPLLQNTPQELKGGNIFIK